VPAWRLSIPCGTSLMIGQRSGIWLTV